MPTQTTVPLSVKIPMVLKNDKQAIQACVKTSNRLDRENVTLVRIKNTNHLNEIEVSETLIPYVKEHQYLEIISDVFPLPFDQNSNLF